MREEFMKEYLYKIQEKDSNKEFKKVNSLHTVVHNQSWWIEKFMATGKYTHCKDMHIPGGDGGYFYLLCVLKKEEKTTEEEKAAEVQARRS